MKRRDVLAGAGLAATTALGFPAPALAQGIRQLKMVTDWPEGLPGVLPSARRLAKHIEVVTAGRIRIEVFASGTFVRPLETFDAVRAGVADMYHSHDSYFGKSAAYNFFTTVPFGLTADELFAWMRFGGGQELWDDLSAQFNIKPLHCATTGAQMGGWFNREIVSPESFKGLRYRMAGLGAEVYRRLGAVVVLLPASEIIPALKSGAIDAAEWVGPWLDMAMGLNKAANYYYYPGFHEPGNAVVLGVNKGVWESFDESDRRLFEIAAASEYATSLADFNTNNARWLRRLRQEGGVRISKFDTAVLKKFAEISRDVVAEAGSADDLSRKIYASYQEFRTLIGEWSDLAEGAYLGIRRQ